MACNLARFTAASRSSSDLWNFRHEHDTSQLSSSVKRGHNSWRFTKHLICSTLIPAGSNHMREHSFTGVFFYTDHFKDEKSPKRLWQCPRQNDLQKPVLAEGRQLLPHWREQCKTYIKVIWQYGICHEQKGLECAVTYTQVNNTNIINQFHKYNTVKKRFPPLLILAYQEIVRGILEAKKEESLA